MNARIRKLFAARGGSDRDASYQAFVELKAATEEPVDWAYEVWDDLLAGLSDKEGSKRAFSAQMLARLAISDPDERMLADFPAVADVMRDEKTVTGRHTLQSIWRVGLAGPKLRARVVDELAQRFEECAPEKNARLVRTDAITSLAELAAATNDPAIARRAAGLIDSEPDEKAQKKQRVSWKKVAGSPVEESS